MCSFVLSRILLKRKKKRNRKKSVPSILILEMAVSFKKASKTKSNLLEFVTKINLRLLLPKAQALAMYIVTSFFFFLSSFRSHKKNLLRFTAEYRCLNPIKSTKIHTIKLEARHLSWRTHWCVHIKQTWFYFINMHIHTYILYTYAWHKSKYFTMNCMHLATQTFLFSINLFVDTAAVRCVIV